MLRHLSLSNKASGVAYTTENRPFSTSFILSSRPSSSPFSALKFRVPVGYLSDLVSDLTTVKGQQQHDHSLT